MLHNRLVVLNERFGSEPTSDAQPTNLEGRAYGRAYLTSSIEGLQYHNQQLALACFKKMAAIFPDLLKQLDTFYQLGCGSQPKGSLGDFASLDIQRNSQLLFDMLDQLYTEPDLINRVEPYRQSAYANANYALGLLSYGANQLQQARSFLVRAIVIDPKLVFNGQIMSILFKSLLGSKLLNWLRTAKG
jgi:tetratricopeptide (TPR) repeat protein